MGLIAMSLILGLVVRPLQNAGTTFQMVYVTLGATLPPVSMMEGSVLLRIVIILMSVEMWLLMMVCV